MKTNQIMIRDDESFVQRTMDGYFNANVLLQSWNESNNKDKQLGNYKKNDSTAEFIEQLKSEGVDNPVMTSRGKDGGTWMHPKLFIDFAMWVSVEFKSKVIDYVIDGLIKSRHDAGDYYNEMCVSILDAHVSAFGCKPKPMLYITEANRLKELLGVKDKKRNEMTEKELNSLTLLQKTNAYLLNKGIGKTARIKQLKMQSEILK